MSATPCLLKLPENCSKVLEAIKTGARLIAEGKLHLPIAAVYPLSAAQEAIMHAQRGREGTLRVFLGCAVRKWTLDARCIPQDARAGDVHCGGASVRIGSQ